MNMQTTKDNALRQQGEGKAMQLDPHDTSPDNLRAIVLAALRTGAKSTIELRHEYGVMSVAQRVMELRRNFRIDTVRICDVTPDGIKHVGIAKYVLVAGVDDYGQV